MMLRGHFKRDCPRCGEEMECSEIKTINGTCIECGLDYTTTASLMSLEEINEKRKYTFGNKPRLQPLAQLKPTLKSWGAKFLNEDIEMKAQDTATENREKGA